MSGYHSQADKNLELEMFEELDHELETGGGEHHPNQCKRAWFECGYNQVQGPNEIHCCRHRLVQLGRESCSHYPLGKGERSKEEDEGSHPTCSLDWKAWLLEAVD